MALTAFNGLWVPPPISGAMTVNTTSQVADASGEKLAIVTRVHRTGNLKYVGFLTGAVVQAQTVRVSFQDLDSSGNPDGTQDQYRDISIADTDDNVWKASGIISSDGTDGGAKRSVTLGDWLAIVFEHNPFNTGDIFRMTYVDSNDPFAGAHQSYVATFASAAWTRRSSVPILTLHYDDDLVYFHTAMYPWSSVTTESFNNGSSPNERGLKFKFPVEVQIGAIAVNVNANAATRDFDVVLYDSDFSTALRTVSFDANNIRSATAAAVCVARFADVTLTADTYYYAMVKPTQASNVTTPIWSVNAAGLLDQTYGGQAFHYATKGAGGGSDTAKRPQISVLVTQIHSGAGGGGILVHPGMAGGMRG